MKSLRFVTLAAAIAALSTAVAVAGAQAPGDRPGFGDHHPPFERALGPQGKQGHWWNNPEMVEKLKLADDQRKQMDAILFDHRASLIDMRASVEKAELAMEPLMRDDQPNEAKILAQIDKIAQARAELEKANARFLLAIRAKLTPEQWKLLQAERGMRHEDRDPWQERGQRQRDDHRDILPPLPPPPGAGPQGSPQSNLDQPLPPDQPSAPSVGADQ
jgi:Spy/CpxP family protein refolding chaperone